LPDSGITHPEPAVLPPGPARPSWAGLWSLTYTTRSRDAYPEATATYPHPHAPVFRISHRPWIVQRSLPRSRVSWEVGRGLVNRDSSNGFRSHGSRGTVHEARERGRARGCTGSWPKWTAGMNGLIQIVNSMATAIPIPIPIPMPDGCAYARSWGSRKRGRIGDNRGEHATTSSLKTHASRLFYSVAGTPSVKQTEVPWPGSDSTRTFPPWRSTILRTMARPMPLPGYRPRACNRWNTRKTRS
jgi:hypothetical protein